MKKDLLLQIDKHKTKLHYLIESDAPYKIIVKQSQKLDYYIAKYYKSKNKV